MKVLYIISNPFYYTTNPVGGSISSGTGVIKGLTECGYQVDIFTDDRLPTVDNDAKITYIFCVGLKTRSLIKKFFSFFSKRLANLVEGLMFKQVIKLQLPSLLRDSLYDFVYIRASHFAGDALFLSKKYGVPSILEVNKPLSMQPYNRALGTLTFPKFGEKIKTIPAEIKQYEFSDLISIDSKLRAKWIIDFVDKKYEGKILINHNGVDENLFTMQEELATNSPERRYQVGMASSFRWYNDIDELMQIIRETIQNQTNIFFKLFIGDTRMQRVIEDQIRESGLEIYISTEYAIPLTEMPKKLAQCDVLIAHFNFHGVWPHNCSIKHLEYMSVGKPVVATDVGEVNFAIRNGENGILVKEGDVKGFAASILQLLNDLPRRKQLGNAGREMVLKHHTWKKHVEKTLTRFMEIKSATDK